MLLSQSKTSSRLLLILLWSVQKLRRQIYRFAHGISDLLEPPEVAVDKLKFEPASTAAVKIAIDAGWIEGLRDGRSHIPSELLRPGQSKELLVRIFRVLTASRLVTEANKQTYMANEKTRLLLNTGVRTGLCHWFDNMAPTFVHLPAYFAANGYHEPADQEHGPYVDVFDCTYWQRVNRTPKLKSDFDTYMASHKKGSSLVDLLPLSSLVNGYDKVFPVLLVDIGGGVGHQCMELKARYPCLPGDLVVQDLGVSKDLQLAGIRGMEYDFFTAQPIKNARFYYYSAIMHDWPDAECVKILKVVAKAMRPAYSRVLINSIILDEGDATYFGACKDLGMMAAMSAKERTLMQMIALATEAGLHYVGQHTRPEASNGIVEFEKRVEKDEVFSDSSSL